MFLKRSYVVLTFRGHNSVAAHDIHQIFTENNNFLGAIFDPTRVARKMCVRNFLKDALSKRFRYGWAR